MINGEVIMNAKVEWVDDEYEDAYDARVKIKQNGWVYFYETDTYHPPHTVDKITDVHEEGHGNSDE